MRILIDSILMFLGVTAAIALLVGLYELLLMVDIESVIVYALVVYLGALIYALMIDQWEKK